MVDHAPGYGESPLIKLLILRPSISHLILVFFLSILGAFKSSDLILD